MATKNALENARENYKWQRSSAVQALEAEFESFKNKVESTSGTAFDLPYGEIESLQGWLDNLKKAAQRVRELDLQLVALNSVKYN